MARDRSSFDVAVVGGGVIGLSVAWRAAQRGARVCVLERAEPGAGTSAIGAGMLAPVSEAVFAERRLLALGLAGAAEYPGFVAELESVTGLDTGYVCCGTLLAARDADETEWLARELAMRKELGLTDVRRLLPSAARRIEPGLAPALRLAVEIDGDHAIDPRRLCAALARAVGEAGGTLRTGVEVERVTVQEDRVTGVAVRAGEPVTADQVVLAAGPWTPAVSGLPEWARVPIHPVKGQIIRMHDPGGPGLLSRVLRMRTGYVVPRGDGRYALGATMEERGFDSTVTAGAVYELLRDAGELLPGVAELVIDELSAGFRPATPDNAPAIGRGALPGLHWAAGHYRHGILLAPVTGRILAGLLAGEAPDELAAPFDPARFAGAVVPVAG